MGWKKEKVCLKIVFSIAEKSASKMWQLKTFKHFNKHRITKSANEGTVGLLQCKYERPRINNLPTPRLCLFCWMGKIIGKVEERRSVFSIAWRKTRALFAFTTSFASERATERKWTDFQIRICSCCCRWGPIRRNKVYAERYRVQMFPFLR